MDLAIFQNIATVRYKQRKVGKVEKKRTKNYCFFPSWSFKIKILQCHIKY